MWKKEQEALAEKKQVEELRKQYDEARQKEEVEAMAVAAGVKKCAAFLRCMGTTFSWQIFVQCLPLSRMAMSTKLLSLR